MLRRLLGAR